jgi:hypothetical protein
MTRSGLCTVLAALVSSLLSSACGGGLDSDAQGGAPGVGSPPPVNTRFTMRIDGKPVALDPPTGTRFVHDKGGMPTHVSLTAQEDPGGGDAIRAASVGLVEPFATGTFDCTPNERGEWIDKRATFSPGSFFGFTPTITDCTVTVQYISNDRAVGTATANAHAPRESSLSGTVAKIAAEFDVPIKEMKL